MKYGEREAHIWGCFFLTLSEENSDGSSVFRDADPSQ